MSWIIHYDLYTDYCLRSNLNVLAGINLVGTLFLIFSIRYTRSVGRPLISSKVFLSSSFGVAFTVVSHAMTLFIIIVKCLWDDLGCDSTTHFIFTLIKNEY